MFDVELNKQEATIEQVLKVKEEYDKAVKEFGIDKELCFYHNDGKIRCRVE
jgi:hypothetical protein